MPKTRLTQRMRHKLVRLAERTVVPKELRAAMDAAYDAVEPLVRAVVTKRFPVKDMKVLAKYQVASQDECITIQSANGGVDQFWFRHGTAPLVVRNSGCGRRIYQLDQPASEALDLWLTAKKEFEEERDRRVRAYHSLVFGSSYLEDVITIWPEAEAVRPVPGTSLIPLNPDVLAMIRSDVQERKAA